MLWLKNKSWLAALGVVGALLAGPGLWAQPQDLAGTMPEDHLPGLKAALEAAWQRSPHLIDAEFERALSEVRMENARAARLPSLGGYLNYAQNQTAISTNTTAQSRDSGGFYHFAVNQALFHWKALKNQSDAARLGQEAARKQQELAMRGLGVVLRQAYLALVVEKADLRHAAETLALRRGELAVTEEKKARGTVSNAVFEGERLAVREAQLQHDRADLVFESSRRHFSRLAALPEELPASAVPDTLPSHPYPADLATALVAAMLRDGAKGALEYEIQDLRVREATLRYAVEKVRLYPKFHASAGYSLENSTNVIGNSVNQQGVQRQFVGVFAQWSIFDGFATRAAMKETLAIRRRHERLRTAGTEELLQKVQALERSLRLDAEQLAIAEVHRGIAVEGHRVVSAEFGFGNVPKADVERARLGVLRAEAAVLRARSTVMGRWCELAALTGAIPVPTSLSPAGHAREK